ncbi:MAG TPA: hypothetical protein VGG72_28945 [Bryobacteraceae bacterium]
MQTFPVHTGLRRASGTSATILHGPTPTFDDSGWEHLDGGRSWGHQTHPKDAYSRRFVELLYETWTLHSGLSGFSMTFLAGSTSNSTQQLNCCGWNPLAGIPGCGARWEHSPPFIPAIDRSS